MKKYVIIFFVLISVTIVTRASRLSIIGGNMTLSPSILPDPRNFTDPAGYTSTLRFISSDAYTNSLTFTLTNRVGTYSNYVLTNTLSAVTPTLVAGEFGGYNGLAFDAANGQFLRCSNYYNGQYSHWFFVINPKFPRDANYKFLVDSANNSGRQQMVVNTGNRFVADSGVGISSDTTDYIRTNLNYILSVKFNPDGNCSVRTNYGTWMAGNAGTASMIGLTVGGDRSASPANYGTFDLGGIYCYADTNLSSIAETYVISNLISAFNINALQ